MGGRILGTLFFLAFFLMGSFFEVFVVREFVLILNRYSWTKTPCQILSSAVETKEGEYRFVVRYEYFIDGKHYVSDTFRGNSSSGDYDKLSRWAQRYPPGSRQTCLVNPTDPTMSILERDNLLFGLLILFPFIFIGIGGIGIFAMWARSKPEKLKSISDTSRGRGFLIVFLSIFALVGLGMMWPLCFRPVYKVIDARKWTQTPCRILHAHVRSHDDDDGTTYSVDILYEYNFKGIVYRSARYDFIGGSSSGRRGKQAVVDAYRKMAHPVCYVNPTNPSEAVLVRKPTLKLLIGLVPWLFFGVGAGGIYGVLRSARRSAKGSVSAWLPQQPVPGRGTEPDIAGWQQPSATVVPDSEWRPLPVTGRRIGGFFGALLITVFWNGIVSVFVTIAIQSFRRGNPEWFLTLFMIPFVLVGIGLIGVVIHQFLSLFNPYPVARIRPGQISLGTTAELEWEFKGLFHRIRELRILLTATEHVRNTSEGGKGKQQMAKSSQLVFERELVRLEDPLQISTGRIIIPVPAEAMHSFDGGNCRLVWAVSFRGDIRIWPNIKDELPIVVVPPNLKESR